MASTTIAASDDSKAPVFVRERANSVLPARREELARHLMGRQGAPMTYAVVAAESTCGCGQALECCHTAHCPRCGIALHR